MYENYKIVMFKETHDMIEHQSSGTWFEITMVTAEKDFSPTQRKPAIDRSELYLNTLSNNEVSGMVSYLTLSLENAYGPHSNGDMKVAGSKFSTALKNIVITTPVPQIEFLENGTLKQSPHLFTARLNLSEKTIDDIENEKEENNA